MNEDEAFFRQPTQPETPPAMLCESCGTTKDVTHAPCPYQSEINNDDTPVWLCETCRGHRADDV